MRMTNLISAVAIAATLWCTPALAQKVSALPAASALNGTELVPASQGSGCATAVSPCASVKATTAQIATYTAASLNTKLVNIAALSPSADTCFNFTSSTAVATFSCPSFGRSVVGASSAGAARTTLGVVIGTDVQAYDADLTTYAGITPSANVQSILGAANYAAVSTLLGLNPTGSSTIAAGAGAGTGPTIAITNGPNGGRITLTTGTTPTLGGVIATVTYINAFPTDSFVVFSGANGNAALQTRFVFADGTASGFVMTNSNTALTASTQYIWDFYVTGK